MGIEIFSGLLLCIVDNWYTNPKPYRAACIFSRGPVWHFVDNVESFFITCWAFGNRALYASIGNTAVFFNNKTHDYSSFHAKFDGIVWVIECTIDKRIEFIITTREFCVFFSYIDNFFWNFRFCID